MNFLASSLGILGGALNSLLGLFQSTMKSGFNTAIQFHKEGVAFARDMGLSQKQAQAYTNVLIERTQVLANKYGVSAEAIMQVQRNLSEATGKQLLLNNAQAEGFVQINKLVGAQSANKFTEEIMNGMGGQIDTVQGAIAKVYSTAAKQGLVAKKLTDKVAQNLSMANRLSFRNGIDGITRMAALSEKLGFNMQSVETAAGQFLELDKAIENAARMQMLGGSAAVSFGNPLTAAYEANYNPEAFAQRLSDSLASYATFDASKGIASVNGMNMDFVRSIASAMGISAEEATRMAKKQSEVRYKETAMGGLLDRVAGSDEAKRNFILNNSQVTNHGRNLEVQGKDINSITPKEWEDMMRVGNMSEEEILREQALKLTSIDEQISGASATVSASFAKGIQESIEPIKQKIQSIGEALSKYSEKWGEDTGKIVAKALNWVNDNGPLINSGVTSILSAVTDTYHFFADGGLRKLLIAFAGYLTLKNALGGMFGGGASGAASGAAKTTMNLGKEIWNATKGITDARYHYNANRFYGDGRIMSAIKAPYQAFGKLSTKGKLLTSGGAALGVGLGAYNALTADNAADRGAGIGTAAGTLIGTALGGPIGAAIGGFVGDFAGRFIGEHWGDITDTISNAWDGIKNWFGEAWDGWLGDIAQIFFPIYGIIKHWDDISNWFESTWKKIGSVWDNVLNGFSNAVSKLWDFVSDPIGSIKNAAKGAISSLFSGAEKHAEGGVVGGNSFNGDKVLAGLNSGEAVITPKQFNTLFSMAESVVKPKPVGEREYIYTPKGNETSNVNGNTITVKDFNINLTGTLKLDGGNNSKNVDINALLNDYQFINKLKEMIKTSINQDMNGGRFLNDLAAMRGQTTSLSIIGR